jgi:hypothetical protein
MGLWIFNTILGLFILWALMLFCNYCWAKRVNQPKASPSIPPEEMTDYENPTGSVSASVSASCSPGIEEDDEGYSEMEEFRRSIRAKYHLKAGRLRPEDVSGYAKYLEGLLNVAVETIREDRLNEVKSAVEKTVKDSTNLKG